MQLKCLYLSQGPNGLAASMIMFGETRVSCSTCCHLLLYIPVCSFVRSLDTLIRQVNRVS